MTGRIKHMQRSKRSSHRRPDFTPFQRNVYYKTMTTNSESLIRRLLAPFTGRKHDA